MFFHVSVPPPEAPNALIPTVVPDATALTIAVAAPPATPTLMFVVVFAATSKSMITSTIFESAGITMTKEAITRSSLTLYLIDETVGFDDTDLAIIQNNNIDNYWLVVNKIDLSDNPKPSISNNTNKTIRISVLEKIGIDLLVQELSSALIPNDQTVGTARARHLGLLNNVTEHLYLSKKYNDNHQIDLVAEELRIAHQDMLRIKGGDINEDLLDKIFSEFCIGK